MYPVMLDVTGKPCLVVGGGGVALRKVEGLLGDGARVCVVATAPHQALIDLGEKGAIQLEQRGYRAGEATDYALVFAATDDREVNRQVFDDARGASLWVNVADDPELCSFHLPARVRRGAFQLAIASAGEAPFVVRRLRQYLERQFGSEWAEWIEAAARFRDEVRALDLPSPEAEARYDRFFAATVDPSTNHARVPTEQEEADWLAGTGEARHGRIPCAPSKVARTLDHSAASQDGPVGFVSLVGGGPGDPGLLTLRGRQRLLAADVVVYDRLAETVLPPELDPRVELRMVGKEAGRHPVPQEEINALLVKLGREGKRVVRLKGGDPYVFGRGGEEAEALSAAGVPFEVVPCVTSGVAALAYAGIPATHRADACRLTLVTAHESKKSGGAQVRWDVMAQDPHATLVGYMGVGSLPGVTEQLIAGGLDPETPAAMIERGTTSAQRTVISTLQGLPQASVDGGIQPPALFVIGQAVRHARKLDWFSQRPLSGQRIGLVAPGGELRDALELGGAEVVEVPLPVTPAARIVLAALPMSGWLFRNGDEVEALEEEHASAAFTPEAVAWCLSRGAADSAGNCRWQRIERLDGSCPVEALVARAQGEV